MFNPDRGGSSDFNNRNSTQQTHSRGGERKNDHNDRNREDRHQGRSRNRWDESDNRESSYRSQRNRSRSRSPVRNASKQEGLNSSNTSLNGKPLNTAKKTYSSNWSDSSSDDEKKKNYQRGGGGGGSEKNNDRSSASSSYSRWDKRSDGERGNIERNPEPLPVRNVYNPLDALKSVNNNEEVGKGFVNTVIPPKISTGIQMKLLTQLKPAPAIAPRTMKPKPNVASVFNVDDDDEVEEMPPECKMRMKNVGRETPTSAGPNSFGKTKIGFCNVIQIKERKIQEQLQKK